MQRNEWKFSYPADVLLDAATKKHTFHQERFKFWDDKKKETVAKIRSEGIEIDESLTNMPLMPGSASNNINAITSRYRGETVSVRADLITDLNECVSKVQEHHRKSNEYSAWMQVLGPQGKTGYDLHQDDWMFFFGK